MTLIIAWFAAHSGSLEALAVAFGAFCQALNTFIPASKGPAWLHDALGRLAMFDKDGKFSWPILQGRGKSGTPAIPPAVALLFFGLFFSLSGCANGYCSKGQNVSTPTCVAERDAIACGMDAVKIMPALFPYVLIQDWQGLIATVEAALRPAVADCILGILDPQIAAKYGATSQSYLAFHQRYQIFRVKIGFAK